MQRTGIVCIALLAALTLASTQARADASCARWNTLEFFEAAEIADVERCLEEGADPNARSERGAMPLHWAAALNENPAVIKALLDAGADPNVRYGRGVTPLYVATALNKNPAIIKALLDAGADPNARTEDGATLLHVAALSNKNPAVIKALLDAGADPNVSHRAWRDAAALGCRDQR